MTELPDVRVGQIWADNDSRCNPHDPRLIEVVELPRMDVPHPGEGKVLVREVANGKQRRIKLRRFRPISSGYRLTKDVPR